MTSVAVVGPTASGKSDVAMAAARAAGSTEIVAIDAMQVYREMDIGTAKPTAADRAAVPHHCLDVVDPGDEFTVAEFQRAAVAALADIADRHQHSLLVAGTGLYLAAVLDRLDIPGTWPQIRDELDADADTDLAATYARLATLDPVAAARIEPTNRRRIVRALEVCLGSGRPFSSFGPGIATFAPIDTVQIGLRWPRPLLAARIEARVHRMMESGLLAEVERLRCGHLSRTARQALGYKELLAHLDGECSLDGAVEQIVARTRRFGARQDRWFRRDPRIRWLDIETDPLVAVPAVVEALAR